MSITDDQRVAYLSTARAVGVRWRGYLSLSAVVLAVAGAGIVVPDVPLTEFYVGVGIGSLVMVMVLAETGVDSPKTKGHLAERFTGQSLRKVRDWHTIDGVAFEHVDVDHVVVTPAGVLAVETKWHGRPLAPQQERNRERGDLVAARRGSRKIENLMRAKGWHGTAPVIPVLVVWGAGRPILHGGHRHVDGVYVVDGAQPDLWSHLFRTACLFRSDRERLADLIGTFANERAEFDAQQNAPLRTQMWQQVKAGVRAERAARSVRVEVLDARRGDDGDLRGRPLAEAA